MNPPRWFWCVVAICLVVATGFFCWNVWHDNQPKAEPDPYAGLTPEQRERSKRIDEEMARRNSN